MNTQHEAGVGKEQKPDVHQSMLNFIELTQEKVAIFKTYGSILCNGFAQEFLERLDNDFISELAAGMHSVNQLLVLHGGTPVEFTDDNDGEKVNGKIVAYQGFDAEKQLWNVRVIQDRSRMTGEFNFRTDEIRDSYFRTLSDGME